MSPTLNRIPDTRYDLGPPICDYLTGVTDQWLMAAPAANPAMLEMFRDRDRKPYRDLLPWSGEFAGKHLTGAVQILRLTGDPKLRQALHGFVRTLIGLQTADGYLGPWPERCALTGKAPNCVGGRGTWDAWGHYHAMLGLLLWFDETGDRKALACVERLGDLICRQFLGKKRRRLVDTGSTEMNLAVIHSLCLLYRQGREQRYLDMALQIVDEFAAQGPEGPLAGDYLNAGLEGVEFFETPKPRWESLHPIMGLIELYWLTGEERFREAFEQIWWSIVKLDRHNNGGFSSGEKAQGNPYHQGAVETCCTVAWSAMSVEMLRLTGNPVVADELELSTLNSIVGLHSHTGRWVTYNTPMDGVRKASAHDIVFQAREGSPELNCCSVNGPRGLGMISDWAVMGDATGLTVNWYGPGTITVPMGVGNHVYLRQTTDYPRTGKVLLEVVPFKATPFDLKLRVPHWSHRTRIRLNGQSLSGIQPGAYHTISRTWVAGDRLEITLDMSLHFWAGQKECRGKASIYRGPVLLTYDRRLNEIDPEAVPTLDGSSLKGRLLKNEERLPTMVKMNLSDAGGRKLTVCDFGSAGEGGSPYRSWLKMKNVPKTQFSRDNPLRSSQQGW